MFNLFVMHAQAIVLRAYTDCFFPFNIQMGNIKSEYKKEKERSAWLCETMGASKINFDCQVHC